ncbi:MAG TPA: arsenate reductase ArsC [Stellaceae bacterium]|jgi:protein-tyrosine-phosphatase|nr:arsenate reductase ArsC [Stellaceae bacterium]
MARLPSSVLFACTFNSIRSPMAEALLKHLHGRHIYVDSVGVRAEEIDPFAVAVMDEIGIDISKHRTKTFEELEDTSFDLVVSLSPEAQHSAVELTRTMSCEVEFWPMLDPTAVEGSREEMLGAYRLVRDHLRRRILERFPLNPGGGGLR